MNVASAVANGVHGALLLARGRIDGLRYIEADLAGAARSFWAMAICLPAFVCLMLLAWTQQGVPPHAGHTFALDLISYVLGWCAFAVMILPKLSSEPPSCSAIATAASLADRTTMPSTASRVVTLRPAPIANLKGSLLSAFSDMFSF